MPGKKNNNPAIITIIICNLQCNQWHGQQTPVLYTKGQKQKKQGMTKEIKCALSNYFHNKKMYTVDFKWQGYLKVADIKIVNFNGLVYTDNNFL